MLLRCAARKRQKWGRDDQVARRLFVAAPKQLRHVQPRDDKKSHQQRKLEFHRLVSVQLTPLLKFLLCFVNDKNVVMIVNRKPLLSNKRWSWVKLIVEISRNRWNFIKNYCGSMRFPWLASVSKVFRERTKFISQAKRWTHFSWTRNSFREQKKSEKHRSCYLGMLAFIVIWI